MFYASFGIPLGLVMFNSIGGNLILANIFIAIIINLSFYAYFVLVIFIVELN